MGASRMGSRGRARIGLNWRARGKDVSENGWPARGRRRQPATHLGPSASMMVVSPCARATTMRVIGCGSGSAKGTVLSTLVPSNSKAAHPLMQSGTKTGGRWCILALCPEPDRSTHALTSSLPS
eukprot:scaffold48750_cov35-Tisochrysis_lutea.AAC.4